MSSAVADKTIDDSIKPQMENYRSVSGCCIATRREHLRSMVESVLAFLDDNPLRRLNENLRAAGDIEHFQVGRFGNIRKRSSFVGRQFSRLCG